MSNKSMIMMASNNYQDSISEFTLTENMLGSLFERGVQDIDGIGMSCGERPDREK